MQPAPNLVIRGKQVVLPGSVGPASIHISGHVITAIKAYDDVPDDAEVTEAGDESIVMPGLVDSHVHINEPGRTEWEGFETATRAAAAGGVTTLVDMPLNSIPPTTTVAGFNEKLAAADGRCFVDVGFWGGVVPGNAGELRNLFDAGVVGFKCFLIHSGVDEFANVTEADLRTAMPELTNLGAVLIVHAEVPGPISTPTDPTASPTKYATFLASRPRAAENEAVALMVKLGSEFGTRIHIVHHSSADALPMLAEARAAGVKITAETCPHYLAFAAEEIPDGATEFKCCPPIREQENQEQLWSALGDGTIDMVVSDHSPCPPEMKLRENGDFLAAWGGISSLQLRLPIVWTEARRRGFSIQDLARWLCSAPAGLVGLADRKGTIAPGFDADLVIWNPEREFTVAGETLFHRHKLTPYNDRLLQGMVEKTFLRGRKIYDHGKLVGEPQGLLLMQTKAT
ncbi:MAG TPA: allantoinase AllB [Pyrinomonadaceae bacterium]|nr:allantoinase AllB [Pyrinomonadaceae bacterium]